MTSTKRRIHVRINGRILVGLALAFAAGSVLVPQPAAAVPEDMFRGGPRLVQPQRSLRAPAPEMQAPAPIVEPQREASPPPVVRGPQYHSYRADTLKRIDFSRSFDDVTTASVEPGAATQREAGFAGATRHLAELRLEALAEVADAVAAHYQERPGFIWLEDGAPGSKAEAALAVLADADAVGLVSADYLVRPPRDMGSAEDRARDAMRFEMELSAKALTYVLDATRGRIDPNRISEYHDFKRKTVDLSQALRIMARSGDIATYLERRSPTHAQFLALRQEYQRLLEAGEGERIEFAEGTLLRPGTRSDMVPKLMAAISMQGSDALQADYAPLLDSYDGDTTYAAEIVELVKDFQAERGLATDGVVGRATIGALTGRSNADKLEKLALAMERARWINRELGDRHVFINAPSFRVSYVEDGEEKLNMRAVMGSKARQTYFFQDAIDHVEFNPYWGVPRSIIVNDMIPRLRKDASYLDRSGYEVTDRSGRRVSSASIDWYSVGANVPYDVRQRPGPRNALGELKIMFPNRHAIYMHDTPDRHLFERDARANSSGCVRLEDPRAMAAAVLGGTVQEVASHIAGGQTKMVRVPEKFPVYIAYFTAWPNAAGEIEYFDDVYGRDDYLARAIEATNAVRHAES